jgi:hypothetical protein
MISLLQLYTTEGVRKLQQVILMIIYQWIFIVPILQGTLSQIQTADAQQ